MALGDYVVIGKNEMTEQPLRKRYSDGKWQLIKSWRGPASLVDDKVTDVQSAESPEDIDVDVQPAATIAIAIGDANAGNVDDTAIWELLGQDLEKPLALHPYYNKSGASTDYIEEADEAIRKGIARITDWDTLHAGFNIQHYVDCRLRGIDSYITSTYIVRKSVTFTTKTAYKAEFASAKDIPGKVIAWTDLEIPASAKFDQPQVHTAYFDGSWKWKDLALNEWLVKSPQVRWHKGQRIWEVTREWWGAEKWLKYIYDGGTYEPST